MALQLEKCNNTIETACNQHSLINDTQKDNIKNCSTVMHTYKNMSTVCQGQVNNCSCWSALNNMTTEVKRCNIGKLEKTLSALNLVVSFVSS